VSSRDVLSVLHRHWEHVPRDAATWDTGKDGAGTSIKLQPRAAGAAQFWVAFTNGGHYLTVVIANNAAVEVVAPATRFGEAEVGYLELLGDLLAAVVRGDVIQSGETSKGVVIASTTVNLGARLLHLTDHDRDMSLKKPYVTRFAAWT
jgi:hypothetical protein